MLPYNLSNPIFFTAAVALIFMVIVFRYFLVAGTFYAIFYLFFSKKWAHRKISNKSFPRKQFLKELQWSLITSLIFAITGAFLALGWQKGYIPVYTSMEEYGIFYFFFSILTLMIIHETYYYWLHRLMHHPKVYKMVHKVHHDSITTSPWTAFSFHPIEGFLEAIILPLMLLFIPVHLYALITYLTIMTLSSVINHLNIEIYPSKFHQHWLGKWLIGASHHSLHHSQFRFNFGLYFTFWDKWVKTESPDFNNLFEAKTIKNSNKDALHSNPGVIKDQLLQ